MKTLILLLLISISAKAQRSENLWLAKDKTYHESIYLRADTMTVAEAFVHLDLLASGKLWFVNRYVIKDGVTYLRYGITLSPRKTFVVKDRKFTIGRGSKRVHI